MDPDQNKPQLPVKSDSSPTPVHDGSEIQRAARLLPRSDSIRIDEKIAIARNEGFNPLAIELAIGSYETSVAHKLLLFGLAIIAAALVAFLFPLDRFFKPQTRDLGTMTIGAPISEDNQALLLEINKPWMKVLLEMDRLYFREGKLSEAIQVAETNLERVPEINWESWKKVHYRYWELLSDAGRTLSLKAATKSYLQAIPEDPFANYYSAHAFLAAVEPIRSFNRDTRQAYRLEAEVLVQQIDRASNALKARQKAGGTAQKKRNLQNLYQKLRLQQAKLFVLIWRLGGYKEDRHPDVAYRDKALDILNRDELTDLKEAKALKISIYNHILDRWHWLEGQQVIQGIKQNRRSMAKELKALQKELKEADTL
jgi:hypothetical protein